MNIDRIPTLSLAVHGAMMLSLFFLSLWWTPNVAVVYLLLESTLVAALLMGRLVDG